MQRQLIPPAGGSALVEGGGLEELWTQQVKCFQLCHLRRVCNFLSIHVCRCGAVTLREVPFLITLGNLLFSFTLYIPLSTYLLSGRSTTVWKKDPVTGTISGKLFSLLSFRAGWEADRLRACASSRLTSFIGREVEGWVRFFTTGAFSVKKESTFQLRGEKRWDQELRVFISLGRLLWRGERRGTCGERGFCQISLPSPRQPYSSECITSRGYACQSKAVLHRLPAPAVDISVRKRCPWEAPGYTCSPLSSLPRFWSSWVSSPCLVTSSSSLPHPSPCLVLGKGAVLKPSTTIPSQRISWLRGEPAVQPEALEFADQCFAVLLATVRTQSPIPCLLHYWKCGCWS